MNKKNSLSIILPTYNEANNIKIIINNLVEILKNNLDYEIIVVDDNSEDKTWEVVKNNFQQQDNIFCYRRIKHQGLSSAIVDGFMLSKYQNMLVLDADMQHDLTLIPKMIKCFFDLLYPMIINAIAEFAAIDPINIKNKINKLTLIGSKIKKIEDNI